MKKITKLVLLMVSILCIGILSGCSDPQDELMILMVKGDLDAMYLNQFDEAYLNMCDMTKEEGEQWYAEGIEYDADYFAYYWGISDDSCVYYDDLEQGLKDAIYKICDTISKQAKYEVKSAAQQDDGSYSVKVVLEPMDIMQQANELYETYEPLLAFWEENENVNYEAISDEEYLALCNAYGYLIVDMVNEVLPNLGYLEEKSLNIQVELIDELWTTNEDDLANFRHHNIVYP